MALTIDGSGCSPRRNTGSDEFSGVDQQTRADAFLEAMLFKVAYALANHRQPLRRGGIDTGLVSDDPEFGLNIRVVKFQTDERCRVLGLRSFRTL